MGEVDTARELLLWLEELSGITSIIRPIKVDAAIIRIDIPWMLGISVILLLLMIPAARSRITRWEGILMIVIYLLYIYLIL